jgi:hypothetical protein
MAGDQQGRGRGQNLGLLVDVGVSHLGEKKPLVSPVRADGVDSGGVTGLAHLASAAFAAHEAWLTAVLIAGDLLAWFPWIGLAGAPRGATPAPLRDTLLPGAGRLIRTGRRVVVRVAAAWPWSGPLWTAVARCAALPGCPPSPPAPVGPPCRFSAVGGSRSHPWVPHAPRLRTPHPAAWARLATRVPTRDETLACDARAPQGTFAIVPSTATERFALMPSLHYLSLDQNGGDCSRWMPTAALRHGGDGHGRVAMQKRCGSSELTASPCSLSGGRSAKRIHSSAKKSVERFCYNAGKSEWPWSWPRTVGQRLMAPTEQVGAIFVASRR